MNNGPFSDLIQRPEKDEYVTVHIVMPKDKGRKIERALIVGRVPWSKRGLLNGTCEEGRVLLKMSVEDSRKGWDQYVAHLCKEATRIEGNSDDVVSSAVELLMGLKEDGTDPDNLTVNCPSCLQVKGGLRDHFPKTATMSWKQYNGNPLMVSNSPCRDCWQGGVDRLDSIKETAKTIATGNTIGDQVIGYRTMQESAWIISLVGPSKVDAAIERIKSEMETAF